MTTLTSFGAHELRALKIRSVGGKIFFPFPALHRNDRIRIRIRIRDLGYIQRNSYLCSQELCQFLVVRLGGLGFH